MNKNLQTIMAKKYLQGVSDGTLAWGLILLPSLVNVYEDGENPLTWEQLCSLCKRLEPELKRQYQEMELNKDYQEMLEYHVEKIREKMGFDN